MAKNKKPKKKYKPKEVYYPQIMTRVNSFGQFEEALQKLVNTGEVELDQDDNYIYRHTDGSIRAFESDLYLYARFVEIRSETKGYQVDITPLWKLRESMLAKGDLCLSEILGMQSTLEICKQILTTIKPTESRDILNILRQEINNCQ